MINREWQNVTVISYTSTTDQYGQTKQTQSGSRTVPMVVHIYSEQEVNNPVYNNVVYVCLTEDSQISDQDKVQIGTEKYNVLRIVPGRLNQVFLQK